MADFDAAIRRFDPPAPATHSCLRRRSTTCSPKARKYGVSRIRLCLQATDLSISGEELPKVSSRTCENSRFVEIFGADRFEHECRPTVPGVRIPLLRPPSSGQTAAELGRES